MIQTPPTQFDILLVDDNAADAKLFQAALKEAATRASAYWVGSGEEALEFLRQQGRFAQIGTVKLVVLDLNMPGIDGIETLRRIKSSPSLNRVPVVLLSSARDAATVDLAYSLGANSFFSKPLSLDLYIAKIRVLVEHWLDFAELPTPLGGTHSPSALSMASLEDDLA